MLVNNIMSYSAFAVVMLLTMLLSTFSIESVAQDSHNVATGATPNQMIQAPGFSINFNTSTTTSSSTNDGSEPEQIANSVQIMLLLTVLSLAPALLIVLSSFTRIIIVLSMLRHAFGMQQNPPNIVLITLALFLTLFTMTPVLEKIDEASLQPLRAGEIDLMEAGDRALPPLRAFMLKNTREKDIALILEIAKEPQPNTADEIKTTYLIPAFLLSELQTAFQIGFVIFLPFLVIDLIVAAILMSMGMIMVPPLTISLPIKVLVFVLIEGWGLVSQALIGSFF